MSWWSQLLLGADKNQDGDNVWSCRHKLLWHFVNQEIGGGAESGTEEQPHSQDLFLTCEADDGNDD